MPAASEIKIKKLGIIAGEGNLPLLLLESCHNQGIETFVIGLKGYASPELKEKSPHIWLKLGAAGHIIKTLKNHNIKDIVMIGAVKKPTLLDLKADWKGIEILARLCWSAGDSTLLSALRREFESEGFHVHGVHKFVNGLLMTEGVLGKHAPQSKDWEDINIGIKASQALGASDEGQSAIVRNGKITGLEGRCGTNALIKKCAGQGGILVKTRKPQQDKDLDLPTIGPDTIIHAAKAGLSGLAVHAENAILVDRENVIQHADKHGLFVVGITVNTEET